MSHLLSFVICYLSYNDISLAPCSCHDHCLSQVAGMTGVAAPLSGQVEVEPNLVVDKLVPEIIFAATNK